MHPYGRNTAIGVEVLYGEYQARAFQVRILAIDRRVLAERTAGHECR